MGYAIPMEEDCERFKKSLNRIKGQINGIDKMLDERRDSIEIIGQIMAAKAALSRVAKDLLKDESSKCFSKDGDIKRIKKLEEIISTVFKYN